MNVSIVVIPNGMILAVYDTENHADIHSRTVTGSRVIHMPLLTRLPGTVLDDVGSDDWDNGTPVQEPESDITQTNPASPRAKSKSTPPKGTK